MWKKGKHLHFLLFFFQSLQKKHHLSALVQYDLGLPRVYSPVHFIGLAHDCTAMHRTNHICKLLVDTNVIDLKSKNDNSISRQKMQPMQGQQSISEQRLAKVCTNDWLICSNLFAFLQLIKIRTLIIRIYFVPNTVFSALICDSVLPYNACTHTQMIWFCDVLRHNCACLFWGSLYCLLGSRMIQ